MTTETPLTIIGTGLCTASFDGLDAWRSNTPSDEPVVPTGQILDRRSRRRASLLMKGLADVYQQSVDSSGVDPETTASVFGSALGEARTMIGLLDQMWASNEAPSPMAFATSVHNAASGAVSIGTKNRAFTTSIAADYDTPAMALVEAQGLLSEGCDAVIIVSGDEAAPEKIVRDEFDWDYFCGGIVLTLDTQHPRRIGQISQPFIDREHLAQLPRLPEKLARNPQAGLLGLLDVLARREAGIVRLDRGDGLGWAVQFTPESA